MDIPMALVISSVTGPAAWHFSKWVNRVIWPLAFIMIAGVMGDNADGDAGDG